MADNKPTDKRAEHDKAEEEKKKAARVSEGEAAMRRGDEKRSADDRVKQDKGTPDIKRPAADDPRVTEGPLPTAPRDETRVPPPPNPGAPDVHQEQAMEKK